MKRYFRIKAVSSCGITSYDENFFVCKDHHEGFIRLRNFIVRKNLRGIHTLYVDDGIIFKSLILNK